MNRKMGASPSCGTSIATEPRQAPGLIAVTSRFTLAREGAALEDQATGLESGRNCPK